MERKKIKLIKKFCFIISGSVVARRSELSVLCQKAYKLWLIIVFSASLIHFFCLLLRIRIMKEWPQVIFRSLSSLTLVIGFIFQLFSLCFFRWCETTLTANDTSKWQREKCAKMNLHIFQKLKIIIAQFGIHNENEIIHQFNSFLV